MIFIRWLALRRASFGKQRGGKKMPKYDPRRDYAVDLKQSKVSVGDVVATFNAFYPKGPRTYVGRVVTVKGNLARLSMMDVSRDGSLTVRRGAPLRFYYKSCWRVPVKGIKMQVADPEDVLAKKVQKKAKALLPTSLSDFKSSDQGVKDEVNAFLASMLQKAGGSAALVLDTATLPSATSLLNTGLVKKVFVPNHDAVEVALMRKRPGVEVKHCSLRQMLEEHSGGLKFKLAFLDYCGAWDEGKAGDVKLLLLKLAKRAVVGLTICRRTSCPGEIGMEDAMRMDFERAANAAGFMHVCVRTFRYAGAMLTCVYELTKVYA